MFVSNFPLNLISISQLTKRNNFLLHFFLNYCVFQDLQTGMIIGTEREKLRTYHLDDQISSTRFVVGTSGFPIQWNQRLGHLSLSKVFILFYPLNLVYLCQNMYHELGMYNCVSYHNRVNNHISVPFELVYTDVLDPCCFSAFKGLDTFLHLWISL